MSQGTTWLLRGGFITFFINFISPLFQFWITCLKALALACFFKERLRNDTQVILKFKILFLQLVHKSSVSVCTVNLLTSTILSLFVGKTKVFPADGSLVTIPVPVPSLVQVTLLKSFTSIKLPFWKKHKFFFRFYRDRSFYVEHSSTERSPTRINTTDTLNSTKPSRTMAREIFTISYVAYLEPKRVANKTDFIDPTVPYCSER